MSESTRRQDVVERTDSFAYDAEQIAQQAGLPIRTVQAWRAGLVINPSEASRCDSAVAALAASGAKGGVQERQDFNDRLHGVWQKPRGR